MTTTLTPALVSTRHPDKPLQDVTSLDLRSSNLDAIGDLSPLGALRKLCLKDNRLTNKSLSGLFHCSDTLTTLDLSENQLDSFANLEGLHKLISLTVSNNQITRLSNHLLGCKNLKALVAVGNQIPKIENLDGCPDLNTLVISHNNVTELSSLSSLKELTKVNASHNPIRVIPDLRANEKLKELRLNDCKLSAVPETIGSNPALELINLGNNAIKSFTDIVHLASLPNLVELNLKGNPITSEPEYEEKVKTLFPTLRILDGQRFDPRYLKNKAKRQALQVRKKLKELGIEKPKKGLKLKETLTQASSTRAEDDQRGSASEADSDDRMDVDSVKRNKAEDTRERRTSATGPKKRAVSQRDEGPADQDRGGRTKRTRKEPPLVGGNALGGKPRAAVASAAKPKAKREAFLVADDGDTNPNHAPVAPAKATATGTNSSKAKAGSKKQSAEAGPAAGARSKPKSSANPALSDSSSAVVASKDSILAPPPSVTGVVEVVVAKPTKRGNAGKAKVDRTKIVRELEMAAARDEDADGLGVGGWD